jgi:hypothetical protein
VQTIVGPGESIGNTDIGNFASYTVRPDDAGSISNNNAVVTVRTQEAEPREFQATATSAVAVDILGGCSRRHGTSESVTARIVTTARTTPQMHSESSLIRQGHGSHTGPVWFPGITVDWGDIIEPFEQSDGTQNPGYNWPEGAQS